MKEYIERSAVMQKFADCVKRSNNSDFAQTPTWNEAVQIVEDAPAADVVEVRHGLNNNTEYADCDQFVCSECGIELQDWRRVERDCDDGEEYYSDYIFRFCPHCGAKTDGGMNDAAD